MNGGFNYCDRQEYHAQLTCHNCQQLLEYEVGGQYVQCSSCFTMNVVQNKTKHGGRVLSVLCPGCGTTNLAPHGAIYVRCGNCHDVCDISHAYSKP